MKTKLVVIALAAVVLLSFTVVSNKKTVIDKSQSKSNNESGFALQDRDQF